jgi:pyrimidine operon attenuation protein/uracil phosphoribosyltransferase
MTPTPTSVTLPDAEQALTVLAEHMRGVAVDARFVGIYSGGAWIAERLARMISGEHPVVTSTFRSTATITIKRG